MKDDSESPKKFVPLSKDAQELVDYLKKHPANEDATTVEEEFGAGEPEEFPTSEPHLSPEDEFDYLKLREARVAQDRALRARRAQVRRLEYENALERSNLKNDDSIFLNWFFKKYLRENENYLS